VSKQADLAIEILRKTNDGDDLDPSDLKFLERAVNGFLNEQGEVAFEAFYNDVMTGYKKPWFHGVENLTIEHSGYVRWKGSIVEHYDLHWAYSAEAKAQAQELGRRCLILESRGQTPTTRNAISTWED